MPPETWSREVPKYKGDPDIWALLRPFLESPVESVFDYRQRESLRRSMESAIKYNSVDLSMETITKGSPHTLRLTKTQASYEKKLSHWEKDMLLLGRLEGG